MILEVLYRGYLQIKNTYANICVFAKIGLNDKLGEWKHGFIKSVQNPIFY
jgi:hypothetical protein